MKTGPYAGNSMIVLFPYNMNGVWVFDDANVGLRQEPFVGEMNDIITRLTSDIPDAASGFCLYWSLQPFPGYQAKLEWRRSDGHGGNWYYVDKVDMEGWLCPAFLKYVEKPPPVMYVKSEAKRR